MFVVGDILICGLYNMDTRERLVQAIDVTTGTKLWDATEAMPKGSLYQDVNNVPTEGMVQVLTRLCYHKDHEDRYRTEKDFQFLFLSFTPTKGSNPPNDAPGVCT